MEPYRSQWTIVLKEAASLFIDFNFHYDPVWS